MTSHDAPNPGDRSTVADGDAFARLRALVRHGAGFVASGITALSTDIAVTSLLHRWFELGPLLARAVGIAVAIVVAWQCHRNLTFRVSAPPTLKEFMQFVAVAWTSLATNYCLYAVILHLRPQTPPELALIVASLGSMFVTYVGMRFGVFRASATLKGPF